MLRILFLKDSLFIPDIYAGTELATHYLCHDLLKRGHRVAAAAGSTGPEFEQAKCDDTCGYPVFRARRFLDAAVTAVDKFRPDAVVCQEPGHWTASPRLKGFKGIAIALFQHSRRDWFTTVPPHIRERAIYLSNSAPTAAFLKNIHGIHSVVIPPVFGIERFAEVQKDGNSVLFVGIQVRKGADIAIEIARARPNVSFNFVASWTVNPEETDRLRNAAASLTNVTLWPNQPDMENLFRTTRLLLMPSRSHEGWGRTATEAQLCGIPVLGSNRGQLGSTIGPGGIALDPDAAIDQWLKAFDSIWNDEGHYRRLSGRAKEHATRLIEQNEAAVERFENCLDSAVRRQHLAVTRLTLRPKAPRAVPLFAGNDFAVMRRLLRLSFAARRAPETWPDICQDIARREVASSRDSGKTISARIARAVDKDEVSCRATAISARAARHECALQVLRGHLPGGWHPKIALEGRHHLDAALARGNGAVLWMAHFAFAGTIVKMALHMAGYRLAHFSRPEHGFSKTRFGIAVLNPIRTSFENRYLSRRIVYRRAQPGAALVSMSELLAQNGVVTMTAGAWEGSRIIETPFLGGTIRLAAGPVRVACESSAALLPIFGLKIGKSDEFCVRIGKEIEFPRNEGLESAARLAADDFLTALAPVVITYPEQWRGWSELIDK